MKEISTINQQKIEFCSVLRDLNPILASLPPHLQTSTCDLKMFSLLQPSDISGLTIGGIDGGYSSRLLLGFDIFLFRAIAVFSTYSPSKILKTSYFPAKTPSLEIAVSDVGLSTLDFESMGSIRRAITELEVANKVITEYLDLRSKKIDLLLLDGSPVVNKPITKNDKILNYYLSYVSILTRLVRKANENGVKLAWIVKDSRSNLFTKLLGRIIPFIIEENPHLFSLDYRQILKRSRDMDLLYYLLLANTRSMVFYRQYSMPKQFAQDFALYSFYLKTAPFDIPLRIELFQSLHQSREERIKEVQILSELILPVSQYNRTYGVPAPIVEADARARIRETEVESLLQLLRKRYNSLGLWTKRRERAPWKL